MNQKINLSNRFLNEILDKAENHCHSKQSKSYFLYHRRRLYDTTKEVIKKYPTLNGVKVLDIGSHYLHFSMILKFLGAEPVGIDVSKFSENKEIIALGKKLKIPTFCMNDLENGLGEFLKNKIDHFL